MVFQFQANHLGTPARMGAACLGELLNQRRGGSHGLVLSTSGVVGSDAVGAAKLKACEQALDGSLGQRELQGDFMGRGVGAPALKKSAGGGGPGGQRA